MSSWVRTYFSFYIRMKYINTVTNEVVDTRRGVLHNGKLVINPTGEQMSSWGYTSLDDSPVNQETPLYIEATYDPDYPNNPLQITGGITFNRAYNALINENREVVVRVLDYFDDNFEISCNLHHQLTEEDVISGTTTIMHSSGLRQFVIQWTADSGLHIDEIKKADLISGKVPASQLPSYVDDVIEGVMQNNTFFPSVSGTNVQEEGKIYVDTTTDKVYRWSGSTYIEISATPTVDNAPTSGSGNLITSGAVYTGLSGKQNTTSHIVVSTTPDQEGEDEPIANTEILNSITSIVTDESSEAGGTSTITITETNGTTTVLRVKNGTPELFEAQYGVTTYEEVVNAYNAGKIVIVKYFYQSCDLVFVLQGFPNGVNVGAAEFFAIRGAVMYRLTLSTQSVWSYLTINLEQSGFKVTSISSSSNDSQYPSAKCVYDELQGKANASDVYTKTEIDNLWGQTGELLDYVLYGGYREVEYIESTGTQYIDTGVHALYGDTIEVVLANTKEVGQYVSGEDKGWGGGTSLANNICGGLRHYSNNVSCHINSKQFSLGLLIADVEVGAYYKETFPIMNGENVTLEKLESGETWSVAVPSDIPTTFDTGNNVYIFNDNGSYQFKGCKRLKSFKMWRENELIRNFVPVRIANTGYLYDKVTHKLFENIGTGEFLYGNDVNNE